jgi:ADP-ribose pyrophosphatase
MSKTDDKKFHLPENAVEVFSGKRWSVHQWQQKCFDGTTQTFETVKRPDTVVILPVMPDGNVIIEKEKQPHWKESYLNLVAGGLEEGEDPFLGARRETEEETGMVFADYHLIAINQPQGGILWTSYVFIATGFQKEIPQHLDSGEEIEVIKITPEELIAKTRKKEFYYAPKIIEDYIVKDEIEKFYETLKHPAAHSILLS